MKKRLFLFAAYNKGAEISQTLIDYLTILSSLGDIVLCFDCDVSKSELKKLNSIKNILHISSVRHGEYDFGSYKRAYSWAQKNKLLSKYDWTYLVNDSVYCLASPEYLLHDLESRNVGLTGIASYSDFQTPEHVQSWFVGLSKKVINEKFMTDFMSGIKTQGSKNDIFLNYEVGLSSTIIRHGFKMSVFIAEPMTSCVQVYQRPLIMLNKFVPFVKKKAIASFGNLDRLNLYADNKNIVENVKSDVLKMGVTPVSQKYIVEYKLAVFGIPVYKKLATPDNICHKGVLFGVPIYKSISN